MASLRRIFLIHTHLPGAVELKLDGHTNICGTNASGKTTLQRLVPVFFGELPSKVVPKTRKKFDEFYLPHANSYLIYEYQREEGDICQVVLTSKPGEGVQYRFVNGPFSEEQILVADGDNKVNALTPEHWLKQLKQLGLEYSPKINATSEYRSIIQNDAGAIRGGKDTTRLRQLAARYAFVAPTHKVRHIEKLVSAVHAKEGKMDTLKTMLAAIFEEDGLVQPTTRVKNTKAREWIKQMRQSMRLEGLQADQQAIGALAAELSNVEGQLLELRPLITADLENSTREKADLQETINSLQQQLNQLKQQFNEQENGLNSRLSEANAELDATSAQLDNIQQKYDQYLDSDMEQLAKDSEALPLWRENLHEQQDHYRIMLEQYGDLEKQLNEQKLKLNESLERLSQKNRKKIRAVEAEREVTRTQQQDKLDELNSQYQARRDEQSQGFDTELNNHRQAIIHLQAQIANQGLTAQEQEDLALSDTRLDYAQEQWRLASKNKEQAASAWQKARAAQDRAQTELEQARQRFHSAKQQKAQLERQLTPEQGSLRHFLRGQLDGWENTVGKVIHEPLLDRTDLNPHLDAGDSSLFGLKLDLAAIDAPDYAQDEQALRIRLEQAEQRRLQAEQQQQVAEKQLEECHQQAQQRQQAVQECERKLNDAEQEVGFARESKQRLQETHKQLLAERRKSAETELKGRERQLAELEQEKQQTLTVLHDDHSEQLLEFKSGWQQEIEQLNEQIADLEQQVDSKREDNRRQIKQLEEAFNLELANKDIDPQTLKSLQQAIKDLQHKIQEVSGRQDELRGYQDFLKVDWQGRRPGLLEQETSLKATQQQLEHELKRCKSDYKTKQGQLNGEKQGHSSQVHHLETLIGQLQPLAKKLEELNLLVTEVPAPIEQLGDVRERLSRANQGLENRARLERKLKDKLNDFESLIAKDAESQFLELMQGELSKLDIDADVRLKLPIFDNLLRILADQQQQILAQGETIGGDLHKFFTVFSDINRRIASQSKRLTQAVADDLSLDGIKRSEVRILSTVDELNFWGPLQKFANLYEDWRESGKQLPGDDYINALADVVELLRSDASYSIESLLRLELHLNEGGSDLVIKNDRQLLESSSHGMAYLILCKFLLAFTRLLRGQAQITIHWPIDEIGTLAYHNVEKLFKACDDNGIHIVGAFPNPESDVLMLFKHRYLIDKQKQRLQRIEPKMSRIAERLAQQNTTLEAQV